jgi:hypothetical protein
LKKYNYYNGLFLSCRPKKEQPANNMPTIFDGTPSEGDRLDIDKSFERLEQKSKEDKTPSESSPEKKEAVKEPSQKGEQKEAVKPKTDNTPAEQLPFHKHPRWIKTQETIKEYEKRVSDYDKRIAELEKGKDTLVLPDWWKTRYGDTPESKKSYENYAANTKAERDRLKEEIKSDIQNKSETETKNQQKADEYVNTSLAEMKDEGLAFERNELLKFMVDFQKEYGAGSLLDTEGNYDFRKSLALMQKMQPKEPDATKDNQKKIGADIMRTKVRTASDKNIPSISRKALRGNWRDAGI